MIGQNFIMKIEGDRAYISPETYFVVSEVLFESVAYFELPCWIGFTVLSNFENNISAKAVSYNNGDTSFPLNQMQWIDELSEVKSFRFKHGVDTMRVLVLHRFSKSGRDLRDAQIHPLRDDKIDEPKEYVREYSKDISIGFMSLIFIDGGVKIEVEIEGSVIDFFIANDSIMSKHDPIKPYFSNLLKKKKVNVSIRYSVLNNLITAISAMSETISQINPELIEEVKISFIERISSRNPLDETVKNIYDIEELANLMGEGALELEGKQLFAALIHLGNYKHAKYLEYLSEMHDYSHTRLKRVIQPWSYLFLITEKDKRFWVWETLDSEEATYLWNIGEEDVETSFNKIEVTLSSIASIGKKKYLQEGEYQPERIRHNYTDIDNGFELWKRDIEAHITL
jgi:hypothetical protein